MEAKRERKLNLAGLLTIEHAARIAAAMALAHLSVRRHTLLEGTMTRSSSVAAAVVALLIGFLIWWRDQHSALVVRAEEARTPPGDATASTEGIVRAVPTARAVPPAALSNGR